MAASSEDDSRLFFIAMKGGEQFGKTQALIHSESPSTGRNADDGRRSEDGRRYAQALVKLVLINMQIEDTDKKRAAQ